MLGFFVALAVDVYNSAAPAMPAPPTPTPSHPLQSQVLQDRQRLMGTMKNVQFVITGGGQVLPEETAQGIEEIACYHLSFQYPAPALSGSPPQKIGENGSFIHAGPYWTAVTESRIAKRSGDTWVEGSAAFAESDWYEHACPGVYKFDSAEAARDPNGKHTVINQD